MRFKNLVKQLSKDSGNLMSWQVPEGHQLFNSVFFYRRIFYFIWNL